MPCSVCKQAGHNKRTCKNVVRDEKEKKKPVKKKTFRRRIQKENNNNIKEKESCCICMEDIRKDGKNVCTTKCGHTFCFDCMAQNICANNNTCPLCRAVIVKKKVVPQKLSRYQQEGINELVYRESRGFQQLHSNYLSDIEQHITRILTENGVGLPNDSRERMMAEYINIAKRQLQPLLTLYGNRCMLYTIQYYEDYLARVR